MEIMKGAESYSFDGNSDIGVLVLQGFTGTTYTIAFKLHVYINNVSFKIKWNFFNI
jgi:hypothetical protein